MSRPAARRRFAAFAVFAAAIVLCAAVAPAVLAQGAGEVAARRLLEVERRLLAEDVAALREARAVEAEAAALVDELISGLDQAVAAGAPAATLAGLEGPVATATAALASAADQVDRALVALGERLRRVRVLGAGVGAAGEPAVPDLLTGRWAVEVEPGDVAGAFLLDQTGTLVSGSYEFDDGSRGSLEGTFVGDLLRLRRIDVTSGFDSVWEARVGAGAQNVEGRWQATILGRGGPGGGEWTAVRVPEGAQVVPEEEVEAGPGGLPLAGPDEGTVAGPGPATPAGTEESPPAGPLEEPVVEEEPLEPEPVDEPPGRATPGGEELP